MPDFDTALHELILEMVKNNRQLITEFYPELAVRPGEMRKMVEAIDRMITDWLAMMPENPDEQKRFFAKHISLAYNFASPYVGAEMKELCERLEKRFKTGSLEIMEMERDGKREDFEYHLVDSMIFHRNMFAAYLGDELRTFDNYWRQDGSSKNNPAPAAS